MIRWTHIHNPYAVSLAMTSSFEIICRFGFRQIEVGHFNLTPRTFVPVSAKWLMSICRVLQRGEHSSFILLTGFIRRKEYFNLKFKGDTFYINVHITCLTELLWERKVVRGEGKFVSHLEVVLKSLPQLEDHSSKIQLKEIYLFFNHILCQALILQGCNTV